ncbi:mitochondrial protein Pet127-domain-containing protein [Gamsiella multidivaricata]|uniref:mitochondrial protein Pet127-domain-containing protein n=1 Tax=Gamsiella multidivaricata TaxID=101098 RepID=UPI00221F4902|nr:mitochondrial protein Pet127-domain-containing protein [Gamsiella multidivaricata]KAI7820236.1 mitochondrial protein Pet127-domain-containing protein [Gamsiella multidivaricata]
MSGAIGISRLAGLRPLSLSYSGAKNTINQQSSHRGLLSVGINQHVNPARAFGKNVGRTSSRTLSTSTVAFKRYPVSAEKEKRRKRLPKGSKASLHDHDHASPILSGSSSAERPAYVKAPSVSAKEMVWAIESSLKGGEQKSALASGSSSALSSSTSVLGLDPFGKAADPFANQLEAAIVASRRSTNPPRNSIVLPDVQAQYLVGRAKWESVKAKDIDIRNVTPKDRPKIASLEHGLDRVLFNPGVHWLQDPRSSVFNFDPYLRSICQPSDFDYDALPAYRTSSLDPALFNVALANRGKYIGSTSSMTTILSQYYYLISGWKPLKTGHLSEAFSSQPRGFTRLSKAPASIQLVYKGNGIYAVDADKTFDSSTILMQLGKSMEKMLTSTPEEFSRYTKENSWQVTKGERETPEAFNYIAVDKFLLRSQLDCEDPRLPGKTFDLKTRAAVAIRLDVHNYELNQGYQLRKAHGYLESFEREYYDMMRSAFLKYSLQVRIGQMDGIFVAFHNTARIFGFQYISLDEMDSRLFGSSVMGDECFKNQLRLLNRTLDEITAKYPEQDLKITVDTDETVQSMNVWVETMPLGAATSPRGRDVEVVFDGNGAPEMQPGSELSLWQIVCYSNINDEPTVGPFDLNERATDAWELRYKIAELQKPHMLNEYRRIMAIQAEILKDDEEKEAAIAAAAAAASADKEEEVSLSKRGARTQSRRDAMRNTLRRISEQGRIKQEDEERRQADKEYLVWEPKGYTKIIDKPAMESSAPESSVVASSVTAPVAAESETIAAKMVRRLRESVAKAASAASTSIDSPVADKESASTPAKLKVGGRAVEHTPAMYYRQYDGKIVKLVADDLALIQKSCTGLLEAPEELERMKHIKKRHEWLITSLNPFDEIRFKMLQVPTRAVDFVFYDRQRLERMSRLMGQPESLLADTDKDSVLRQKLFDAVPLFRNKLLLDYFHNWIHKVVTLDKDARPFKKLEDFLSVDDEEALLRAANGISITERMVQKQAFVQGLQPKDAMKKAILVQIFYSEQAFKDEELQAMGYFPRIFDHAVYQNTLDILKGVGTKGIRTTTTSTKTDPAPSSA